MNDLVLKYAELEIIHAALCEKIQKVHHIMFYQDIQFLTHGLDDYRQRYLRQLHSHRRLIADQQSALLDQIDIKEIMSVLQL